MARPGIHALAHAPVGNPLSIAGCVLWLDSRRDVGLSGSNVYQWGDGSGGGNTPSQATESLQPQYQASAINGLPAIRLTGTVGDYLSQTTTNLVTAGGTYSVFVVGLCLSSTADNQIICLRRTSQAEAYSIGISGSTHRSFSSGSQTYNFAGTPFTNIATAAWQYNWRANGAGIKPDFRFNRAALTITSAGTQITGTGSAGWHLGRDLNVGTVGMGDCGAMIVYNRVVSFAELTDIETYLKDRFSLP